MKLISAPLDAINADDLAQLCHDQVAESPHIELKSDLPTRKKNGQALDPWHGGGSFGEYARNAIAEEIVAFANTAGGVV